MFFNSINKRGETIVEVLFAIAILGFAMGISFASANRSNKAVQANKERYQATLYANQQADKIRALISTSSGIRGTLNGGTNCINSLNQVAASTDTSCKFDNLYEASITKVNQPGSPSTTYDLYKIRIQWDSLTKGINGKDNVEIYYGS